MLPETKYLMLRSEMDALCPFVLYLGSGGGGSSCCGSVTFGLVALFAKLAALFLDLEVNFTS